MGHLEEEVLSAYCDGQVDERTIDAIEEHLIVCDDCAEAVRRIFFDSERPGGTGVERRL